MFWSPTHLQNTFKSITCFHPSFPFLWGSTPSTSCSSDLRDLLCFFPFLHICNLFLSWPFTCPKFSYLQNPWHVSTHIHTHTNVQVTPCSSLSNTLFSYFLKMKQSLSLMLTFSSPPEPLLQALCPWNATEIAVNEQIQQTLFNPYFTFRYTCHHCYFFLFGIFSSFTCLNVSLSPPLPTILFSLSCLFTRSFVSSHYLLIFSELLLDPTVISTSTWCTGTSSICVVSSLGIWDTKQ